MQVRYTRTINATGGLNHAVGMTKEGSFDSWHPHVKFGVVAVVLTHEGEYEVVPAQYLVNVKLVEHREMQEDIRQEDARQKEWDNAIPDRDGNRYRQVPITSQNPLGLERLTNPADDTQEDAS